VEEPVLQMFAFSSCAVIVRHWFEISLRDASMEHGARIEVRELTPYPHRGSESAAQLITADRPLWRADLFDRLDGQPGNYAAAHYHPAFAGDEPSSRMWDRSLTADPWSWLGEQVTSCGAAAGGDPWPLAVADAADLSRYASQVVTAARAFAPETCHSAGQCHQLTQDVTEIVRIMIDTLERPELLDRAWVKPWMAPA
jgi:hypothetical protein